MLGMALVPEKRELFGSMPVEDNLLLGGYRQMRLRNRQWRQRLDDVYAIFPRLKERRMQLAGTLSGGERQMLAVGRALMSRPRLLMLDEPSLGLAPLVVRDIFRTIESLRQTGVTILLVEQNARAALEVADHGYVLEMGEIALQGAGADLAGDPRVIDTYLGAAAKKDRTAPERPATMTTAAPDARARPRPRSTGRHQLPRKPARLQRAARGAGRDRGVPGAHGRVRPAAGRFFGAVADHAQPRHHLAPVVHHARHPAAQPGGNDQRPGKARTDRRASPIRATAGPWGCT